jgi:4-amino-4-deoxy-L-arabinose transferase-like glycosyltransferase
MNRLKPLLSFLLRREWLILIALVLLTRVGFLIVFGHTLSLATSGYDVYAVNLLNGHGYTRFADFHPDSDLPPLYSFLLAAIYATLGRNALNVALVQIAFEVITVLCISRIGHLVGGRRVGLLAGILTALYPYQLFQDLTVNDTAVFICLLTAGLYFAGRALREADRNYWNWAICGLLLGIAALTKTLALVVVPGLLLACWLRFGWRSALRAAVTLGVAAMIVIAPWMVRNTQLNGTFTLISTNDGSNFYQGNNRCSISYMEAGWDVQWSEMGGCLTPTPAGLSDLQISRWQMQQGIDYLKANVGLLPRLIADKFIVLWNPDITPRGLPPNLPLASNDPVEQYNTPVFEIARIVHLIYFTPSLLFAIAGLLLTLRRRPLATILPIISVIGAVTLTYLIFHPSTRYRAPADPFVFILTAYALIALWAAVRRRVRPA